MNEPEETNLASSESPPREPARPNFLFGILMLILLGPVVAFLVFFIANGSITTTSSLLVASAFIFVGTAVIAHFFVGHRATWILPVLVVLMGCMGCFAGVVGHELTMCLFGAALILVGFGWNVSSESTHPVAKWIVKLRTDLLRSTDDDK